MKRRLRAFGFTLIELMLGLVLLSLIGGAVSAVLLAVSEGWQQGEASQGLSLSSSVPMQSITVSLRSAKYLGYVHQGDIDGTGSPPASVIYWKGDSFGPIGQPDGRIQLGELAVLTYDVGLKAILLYEAIPYDKMTPSQRLAAGDEPTAVTNYAGMVTNPSAAEEFIGLLNGNTIRLRRMLARNVTAAEFIPVNADNPSSATRPGIEVMYRVERGRDQDATAAAGSTRSHLEYQFITLRSASGRPN